MPNWKVRMRKVNNDCDNLRTYRVIVDFEQGIEIFGALVEMEMDQEGSGARRKISIRKNYGS